MAIIESLGVISIMPFLAVLANPNIVENNSIFNKLYLFFGVVDYKQFIVYLGFVSLFFIVFSTIFKVITLYCLNYFSGLQRYKLSSRLLNIYLVQDYDFFISKNSSELVKNVLSEIDHLIWSMIHPALFMMSYSVVIIAMIIILLINDPIIALSTSLIIFIFYLSIYMVVKKKLDKVGEKFAIANTERFESCQEALGGIKDVIINQAQNGYLDKFEYHSKQFSEHLSTKEVLGQVPRYVIETVGYGCLIVIALILVLSNKDVSHIFPVLGLYGFAAYRLLPAAQNVYNSVTQIKFSEYIFKKIKEEFELEHKFTSSEKLDLKLLKFSNKIELENISFSYPNRSDKKIFENFSLTISKNECLGIVGKSGSGKSTLMDILLGLLIPQEGKLKIDGVELNRRNIHLWRELVGYVPQTIFLANKSVAENIAFGVPKHKIKMEMVSLAAKQAQIDEFILNELLDGYDSIVGERGVMLSGGQRQRIGIARALYRNPQVLFMDEATSALDVETEQAVNESIQKLNGEITIVIIAHRKSAVEKCDRILFLN
ncbi:MAG: ABC transporter ATP-binding protein [Bacilli bacterium]